MYIIKKVSTGELRLWANCREDDFLKYVPSQLGTTKSDLEVYLLPDICQNFLELDQPLVVDDKGAGPILEVYESSIEDPNNAGETLLQNLEVTHTSQLVAWPYDENGVYTPPAEFTP